RPATHPHGEPINAPPQSRVRDEAHLRDRAVVAAGTVGLLPSADGHGALLASSALVGPEASRPPAPAPLPPPVRGGAPPIAQPAPAVPGSMMVGWCVAGALGLVAVVVEVALVTRRRSMSRPRRVRIVGAPPVEAPDYVRRVWIVLELPLACGQ